MVINGLLEFLNIQADICNNSYEAIQSFQQKQGNYDVIFMDCELPDRDAFQTTQLIRQSQFAQTSLKIIALTAHSLIYHQQQAKQAGMDYFLTKPLRLEALEQILRLIISQQSTAPIE